MRGLRFVAGAAVVFALVAMMPIASQAADQIGEACRISSDSGTETHCLTMTSTDTVQYVAGRKSRGGR
jgi:hypothetical protein